MTHKINTPEIYVSLDDMYCNDAEALIEKLSNRVGYKVNDLMFTSGFSQVVYKVKQVGAKLFLDAKIHDIPSTAGNITKKLLSYDPDIITAHCSGGRTMLKHIKSRLAGTKTVLVGVNILTSEDHDTDRVKKLTAYASGIVDGFVCSADALELGIFLENEIKVVPGIRPSSWSAASNDHRRPISPALAVQLGATHLVIGRPITQDVNPAGALNQILGELNAL